MLDWALVRSCLMLSGSSAISVLGFMTFYSERRVELMSLNSVWFYWSKVGVDGILAAFSQLCSFVIEELVLLCGPLLIVSVVIGDGSSGTMICVVRYLHSVS